MSDEILIFPTDEKPSRADAIRNRRRLLEIARQMLDDGTLEVSTMSDIARTAGVGKGTLYRHFADKSELCHALLDEAMRDFQARTLSALGSGHLPAATLRWFLSETLAYVERHSQALHEAAARSRPADMLGHPAHLWWRQTIRGLLEQCGLRQDVDYLADVLYVMIDIQTVRFQQQRGSSRASLEQGLLTLLDGILATRPAPD